MAERLTETLVKGLTPPAKGSRRVYDSEVTGFLLRLFAPTKSCPDGGRTFALAYWIDGRERLYRIGSSPDWSVTAARGEAKLVRQRVDQGQDPAGDRRERRDAPTIQDLINRYIAEHLPTKTAGQHSPKLAAQRVKDEKKMLAEIGNRLGLQTKVADVHAGDITKMHRDISESIGRQGRPRPVRANRILAIASKMFSLALMPRAGETKPWRDAAMGNPCKGVKRNHEEEREYFYSQAELAIVADTLSDHGSSAKEPWRTVARAGADAIRLVMVTGARPAEVAYATWQQFDAEPSFWIKPSAHVKQRKTHKLPLSPPAIELIERLRKARKRDATWVFPGAVAGEPLAQFHHVWDVVCVALWAGSKDPNVAAIVADLEAKLGQRPSGDQCRAEARRRNVSLPQCRLYDLRHTFASVGAGGGLSLPIIGRLLGHTQARTTQRYAHLADDPLREAAAKIGAVISGAGQAGAEVVPLKREGR
jgi:integrase